jgi:hypothetical protein
MIAPAIVAVAVTVAEWGLLRADGENSPVPRRRRCVSGPFRCLRPGIAIAPGISMWRRAVLCAFTWWLLAPAQTTTVPQVPAWERVATYRLETAAPREAPPTQRFDPAQLAILEKLNRADVGHLARLPELVVPESWVAEERAYSPLPYYYPSSEQFPKVLVVHLPGQVFGAYESGVLVRWGPVNTGGRKSQTPSGPFSLNWRSTGHNSSVDPDWYMAWYFNFASVEGIAFHEYSLPGLPVSHGCIRMLSRDAQWLYHWGEPWTFQGGAPKPGTPVFIVGAYDFDAPPPWRSPDWLSRPVELPRLPHAETF